MRYNPALGVQGNLVNTIGKVTNNTEHIEENKNEADKEMLEIQSNVVEAVIDEYNAIIE